MNPFDTTNRFPVDPAVASGHPPVAFGRVGVLLVNLGTPDGTDYAFRLCAVDAAGNVCVATLFNPGITVISPSGSFRHIPIPGDPYVTNICFGGRDLQTAYVTCAQWGKLVAFRWPRPGLKLNWM